MTSAHILDVCCTRSASHVARTCFASHASGTSITPHCTFGKFAGRALVSSASAETGIKIHDETSCNRNPTLRRRVLLSSTAFISVGALLRMLPADAAPMPPSPPVGSCADCIGEVETTLNVCNEDAISCVSTSNDDEAHFLPPWSYDGPRDAAINHLVSIATGGGASAGLSSEPLGISSSSAAGFILGGVAAVMSGGAMPDQPERAKAGIAALFDGVLSERHTTGEEAEYVRLTFGSEGGSAQFVTDPSSVVDAEFIFPSDDNIVVLRAASRVQPQGRGSLGLNFSKGLVFDNNTAARSLEQLRKALRWEVVPVITDFDPRFNGNKPLWFENLYKPFIKLRYGRDFSQEAEDQSTRPLIDGRRV